MLPVLASSAPSLRVFGNTSTLELAPVLLAAQTLYKGMASVSNGGIPNLFQGADLATNAETQTLLQSTDHANLRIIFTVCEGWYRIVANRTSAISTLADLRSKKVATIPNTSSAYYLHKMLKSVNLTDSDVTSISMTGPASAQTILQAHQADAVTIWEPEIQHAASALGADVIEFQDRAVYRELFNLHTTAEKLSDQTTRRGIVELVKALVIASDQIRKHPETVWPIVSKSTGFDEQLISQVWVNEGFAGTLAPDLLDVLEEEEAWLARSRGRSARSRTELGTLIDDTVLRDALH
jgi:NitT/TauT family transport system substrate-binding protein